MKDWQSQAHVKWECKYHVVIVPKYRKKTIYGKLRHEIGELFRQLCRQKEIELLEGHAMVDHVHMLLSVPARYSIAMTVGYLKPIFDSNPGYPPPESLILGQKRGIPLGGQRNVVP
jgi:putative transposase